MAITFLLLLQLTVFPNPALTPGLTRPITKEIICTTLWGQNPRVLTPAMRLHIFTSYGIPSDQWSLYKLDHRISRSIGGQDSILNLWPQPVAESYAKDVEERRLLGEVCAGRLTVKQAQKIELALTVQK